MDLDKVKMGMRQSEPQAGDDSKKAMDEKQKDVARRSAELKKKQAEAAGVYKEGYATPLRVDSPAGVDLDADKDPEEQPAGFDLDVEEDRDDPADRERLMSAIGKIGSTNQALELARQRRAGRKREAEERRRTGGGPGGGPGGDPKEPTLAEINAAVYRNYLPEDVVNHPDPNALEEAAKDAAKKNYDEQFSDKEPESVEEVRINGDRYQKQTFPSGAVFFVGSDGSVLRGKDDPSAKGVQSAFDHFNTLQDEAMRAIQHELDRYHMHYLNEEGS